MADLHLIKLCVGCDSPDELLEWRRASAAKGEPWILRTRQTPKRAEALTTGGSLYRVFKGLILTRQHIVEVRTVGEGPAKRCEMVLDETLVLTAPTPRRPFQGWRYLALGDAPTDLPVTGDSPLPPAFARKLLEAGVW